MEIDGLPGAHVSGSATCAPATFGLTSGFQPTTQGAPTGGTLMSNGNIDTLCGLGEVFSSSLPPYTWSSSSSFATVANNSHSGAPGDSSNYTPGNATWTMKESGAQAQATCGSASSLNRLFFVYHAVAPAGGTTSFQLLQSDKQNLPTGTSCFLTSIEGTFDGNDDSFTDGIGLSFDGTHWTMTASNGKQGWALCAN